MSQRYVPAGAAGYHGHPWYDVAQAQHYSFTGDAKKSIDGILHDKKTKARRNNESWKGPHTDEETLSERGGLLSCWHDSSIGGGLMAQSALTSFFAPADLQPASCSDQQNPA